MTTVTKMLGALAALGACVGMTTTAAANPYLPCLEERDITSARIHEMRVMMLVSALKCRDIIPATWRSYGQLLNQRDGEFRYHADRVERLLVTKYGGRSGRIAFADYETLLGNYHSNDRQTFDSCGDMGAFVRLVQRAESAELHALSGLMPRSAVRSCPPADYTGPAAAGGYGAPVRVHRGPGAIIAHGHTETVADVASDEEDSQDLTPLATRVAPVTPLARIDPTPAKPPASRSDRLGDAIKALDSAAAALREMQTEPPVGRP